MIKPSANVDQTNLSAPQIFQAGQSEAVDMLLNFPVMDINRNAIYAPSRESATSRHRSHEQVWGTIRGAAQPMSRASSKSYFPRRIKSNNPTMPSLRRFGSLEESGRIQFRA
jgi:hypothetical protein